MELNDMLQLRDFIEECIKCLKLDLAGEELALANINEQIEEAMQHLKCVQ